MKKWLIIVGLILIAAAAYIMFVRTNGDGQVPAITPPVSPTVSISPTTDEDKISMDVFVESVGEGRVGFQNARLLQVNEGHVVTNIYITDETEIDGEVTVETLEDLEVGTPVRVIGTPAEGGILAQQLIINPPDHSPQPQLP